MVGDHSVNLVTSRDSESKREKMTVRPPPLPQRLTDYSNLPELSEIFEIGGKCQKLGD